MKNQQYTNWYFHPVHKTTGSEVREPENKSNQVNTILVQASMRTRKERGPGPQHRFSILNLASSLCILTLKWSSYLVIMFHYLQGLKQQKNCHVI